MLFNSYEFIFIFLPISLFLFYLLRKTSNKQIILFGFIAISLFFYGWWDPKNLVLIIASILVNYFLSKKIYETSNRIYFITGIIFNLGILIYYKYAGYLFSLAYPLSPLLNVVQNITLPLAISFFTFQQISYLIDIWKKQIVPGDFSEYALCVLFFPHLIAGPIIRYHIIYPQFKKFLEKNSITIENYIVGFTIFLIGLFKKTSIADMFIPFVDKIFQQAEAKYAIGFIDGWIGSLSYTFQLYFDFSGYSDMAIGLSYMLGILLPINFNSPYKAQSIIDFWRRWHISLSDFFRDYIYISLGGNRVTVMRRLMNVFLVMGIVGLWHGAGNTFVLWGLYHGLLLVCNHIFVMCKDKMHFKTVQRFINGLLFKNISWLMTFSCVIVGWVMFRAKDYRAAISIYKGMLGRRGLHGAYHVFYDERQYYCVIIMLSISFLLVTFFPNTLELMSQWKVTLNQDHALRNNNASAINLQWKLNLMYSLFMGFLAYFAFSNMARINTTFLYFNF